MKKPSSKIREEIARLQDQLKQAETREAERDGKAVPEIIEAHGNDLSGKTAQPPNSEPVGR